MPKLTDRREEELFERIAEIIESARGHVARAANSAMVHAYWLIGGEIVEVEQHGQERAGYGEELMNRLAERLTAKFGKGFGARTLCRLRLFYLTFPKGSALLSDPSAVGKWAALLSKSTAIESALFPPHLGWTHYLVLTRIENPTARAFYEIESAQENWTSRELERIPNTTAMCFVVVLRLENSRIRVEVNNDMLSEAESRSVLPQKCSLI